MDTAPGTPDPLKHVKYKNKPETKIKQNKNQIIKYCTIQEKLRDMYMSFKYDDTTHAYTHSKGMT